MPFCDNSINLGSPYINVAGSDSPKLSGLSHHLASNFVSNAAAAAASKPFPGFPLQPASAFNFAAFRSPGTGSGIINPSAAAAAAVAAHGFSPFASQFITGASNPQSVFNYNHCQNYRDENSSNSIEFNQSVKYMRQNSSSPANQYTGASNSPVLETPSDYQPFKPNKDSGNYHSSCINNNTIERNNTDSSGPINHRLEDSATITSCLQSESPELNNHRYENNNSPVDSAQSYPVSQKSSEDTGGQSPPPGGDSLDTRSPENLSSKRFSDYPSPKIAVPEMLEHKLPLSFLGPPLAALHSMTEMKSPGGPPRLNEHGPLGGGSAGVGGGIGAGLGATQTSTQNSHGTANPHGIDTILSRPPPVTSNGLNALAGGEFRLL